MCISTFYCFKNFCIAKMPNLRQNPQLETSPCTMSKSGFQEDIKNGDHWAQKITALLFSAIDNKHSKGLFRHYLGGIGVWGVNHSRLGPTVDF